MRSVIPLVLLIVNLTAAMSEPTVPTDTAVLGGGCFWCIEAVFERLNGVTAVEAGYAGGATGNPTYEQVCSGATGHAEVARITFDPSKISYDSLLNVFWEAHDPTTLNRQGADAGTQYRSIILFRSLQQQAAAERSMEKARKSFDAPIVTEIKPLTTFFKAEHYHQDYFRNHPDAPYCIFVIKPKLHKLKLD